MGYKEKTAELNRIPIVTVASMLGVTLSDKKNSNCPLPGHRDSNPSFSIWREKNWWKCFGCGESGGAIDLVMSYKGLSFEQARAWLLESTSSNNFPKIRRQFSRKHTNPKKVASEPDPEVLQEYWRQSPLENSGKDYMERRGFSNQTIERFNIGQISSNLTKVKSLIYKYGYSRIERSGLLAKSSTQNKVRTTFWDGGILVPFFEDGEIVYLQSRKLATGAGQKWQNLSHQDQRIFNAESLNSRDSEVWICEGAFDTISAYQLGWSAIGLLGASMRLTTRTIEKLRGRLVRIAFDWDPAGAEAAEETRILLLRHGVTATILKQPSTSASDLNDYLVEQQKRS